jgi:hypothetical protein
MANGGFWPHCDDVAWHDRAAGVFLKADKQ